MRASGCLGALRFSIAAVTPLGADTIPGHRDAR